MDNYHSKKSSIRDSNTIVYEALDRGHQSDITRVKKPDKAITASGRRMFTFIGSAGGKQHQHQHQHQPQRTHAAPPPPPSISSRSRTPSKMTATPRTRTPLSKRRPRSRSQRPSSIKQLSVKRDRSSRSKLSDTNNNNTNENTNSNSKKDRSRSTSAAAKKDSSRSSSTNSKNREIVTDEARKSAKQPNTPIQVEIPPPTHPSETISPAILVGDEQKIETKDEPASPILPSVSSPDDDQKLEEEELSSSPSVVGYRKILYNEMDDKWVEHWKIEEDVKRAQKKAKAQKLMNKWEAEKKVNKVHPVKGKITAKIQVMFPTAIVKPDRRHGGALYQSILMTDPLRIELHKRRAPIVPTYYQEHIAKYGKLPFRNNPRPHPIV